MDIIKRKVIHSDSTAQEAHEAIRPTDISFDAQQMKNEDEKNLYVLITQRTLIGFLPDSVEKHYIKEFLNRPAGKDYFLLRTVFKEVIDLGFKKILTSDDKDDIPSINISLPSEFDFDFSSRSKKQLIKNITKPPQHFTEATIIKEMKKKGIGRPSTYAMITETIKDRDYVSKKGDKLISTLAGQKVLDYLRKELNKYQDVKLTAEMESSLDSIAAGKLEKTSFLREFYSDLEKSLLNLDPNFSVLEKKTVEVSETKCPECGSDMHIREGKFGTFLGCSNYPECKKTIAVDKDGSIKVPPKPEPSTEEECPECGEKSLVKRTSKTGKEFYGCSKFPKCKGAK